jgi:ABC-type nitrate/sulfonate/bicarbonate transport system substrate-binding protein
MKGLSQMIRTRRKVALTMAMLFGVAIIATACSDNSSSTGAVASGSTSAAPATLDVELDWVPNPDHVGLFSA